jgi:hypothetical protein
MSLRSMESLRPCLAWNSPLIPPQFCVAMEIGDSGCCVSGWLLWGGPRGGLGGRGRACEGGGVTGRGLGGGSSLPRVAKIITICP